MSIASSIFGNRKFLVRIILVTGCFFLAWLRFTNLSERDGSLDSHLNQKADVRGRVIEMPEMRNGSPRFQFQISEIKNGNGLWEKVLTRRGRSPKVLVRSVFFGSEISYGDVLEFSATVKVPELIASEDGRTFDYKSFLAKDDMHYILETRSFVVLELGRGNPVVSFLYGVKKRLVNNIEDSLPSPHSFLASGLIISGKGSMGKELQEKFQIAGLIHIVVLSGSNVSIIGEAILKVFSFLPKTLASVFGGLGIVAFSIMTGGGATVVRSTIMSIIALYARVTNRTNQALVSLGTAGILMIVHNPRILFHDPSFQLSFLASLGLILYSERIKDKMLFLHARLKVPVSVIDLVSCTVSTQLFTLPYIINMSGLFSVVALLVNIVVLPVIPFTMLMVFVVSVFSFISPHLASVPAFVSWILLSYELAVVDFSSAVKWSHVLIPPISVRWVYLAYLVFAADISLYQIRFMGRKQKIPQLNI